MNVVVDAILFDSDGVLVDSHVETETAWTALIEEFGIDRQTVLAEMVGVRAEDTLARHVAQDRLPEAIRRLEDLEVGLAGSTEPICGARDLLTSLPNDRWTIVTSASRRLGEARWRGARLPIPAQPITAESVTAGKPDPAPYLAGAHALGVDPARCLVFEDADAGARAATAAGIPVVAVGHRPWTVDPVARVRDLSSVLAEITAGRLTITMPDDPIDTLKGRDHSIGPTTREIRERERHSEADDER